MPPRRRSQRRAAQHPTGQHQSNAAVPLQPVSQAQQAPGMVQQATQPGPPNPILTLPPELRIKIYGYLIPRMRKVVLDTSKQVRALGTHPITQTSKEIRSDFLAQVRATHRNSIIIAEVKDFDFGRLIHHLRQNDRLNLPKLLVKIRHSVTTPNIDSDKLLAWLKFEGRSSLVARYKVFARPPVAMRRAFMTSVYRMYEDLRMDWPETERMMRIFVRDWDKGKCEMKRASPDEKPPMGADWEKSAGTDVDSDGEDTDEEASELGEEEDEGAEDAGQNVEVEEGQEGDG